MCERSPHTHIGVGDFHLLAIQLLSRATRLEGLQRPYAAELGREIRPRGEDPQAEVSSHPVTHPAKMSSRPAQPRNQPISRHGRSRSRKGITVPGQVFPRGLARSPTARARLKFIRLCALDGVICRDGVGTASHHRLDITSPGRKSLPSFRHKHWVVGTVATHSGVPPASCSKSFPLLTPPSLTKNA